MNLKLKISTNWKKLDEPSGWDLRDVMLFFISVWSFYFPQGFLAVTGSVFCFFFPSVFLRLLHRILMSACFDLNTWNLLECFMIQQIDKWQRRYHSYRETNGFPLSVAGAKAAITLEGRPECNFDTWDRWIRPCRPSLTDPNQPPLFWQLQLMILQVKISDKYTPPTHTHTHTHFKWRPKWTNRWVCPPIRLLFTQTMSARRR